MPLCILVRLCYGNEVATTNILTRSSHKTGAAKEGKNSELATRSDIRRWPSNMIAMFSGKVHCK